MRRFGAFTEDLHLLADWLKVHNITSVAMESTGVYWIPLFQILESRGFEVYLVNARHMKGVPGRKTDVLDCQWIQYLHSVGLLRSSFRPTGPICAVRSLLRHRQNLVETAATFVQRMQKALMEMNLHLHHVISDITGTTGLAIIEDILAGQRDPKTLAKHRDYRIKASVATIAKALVGDYRREHLFCLRQNFQAYQSFRQLILDCDQEIETTLAKLSTKTNLPLPTPTKKPRKPERNQPEFDLRSHLYRAQGVDVTQIDGIGLNIAHTLFTEIGPDLSKFPTDKHFASWLGLCPDNRISGGKILSSRTRHVPHRASKAFRMAAQSVGNSHSPLGTYHRRIRARLGPAKANTATAHRLARIYYHVVKNRSPFDPSILENSIRQDPVKLEKRLRSQAKLLGFVLVPA